jgi:hypothetical protein
MSAATMDPAVEAGTGRRQTGTAEIGDQQHSPKKEYCRPNVQRLE